VCHHVVHMVCRQCDGEWCVLIGGCCFRLGYSFMSGLIALNLCIFTRILQQGRPHIPATVRVRLSCLDIGHQGSSSSCSRCLLCT
jgi:hypothetical protein